MPPASCAVKQPHLKYRRPRRFKFNPIQSNAAGFRPSATLNKPSGGSR
nr:MAG TPA: hypothetical protein [Caudoviricetes sp.]